MSDSQIKKRVLVIEDDEDLRQLLAINLQDLFLDVECSADGVNGFNRASNNQYQLIVLDIMLPGMDGLEICRRLREVGITTPILMLTAKSSELDRVLGLELGADDYLTKPFSIKELQARIKAIFRRIEILSTQTQQSSSQQLHFGLLTIEPSSRKVFISDQEIELTVKEFDLLLHFASNPGRVYSRSQLLDTLWGYSHTGYEHTVNSHINRLRKKINNVSQQHEYIETVWGVGYRFQQQVSTHA